MNQMNRRHAVIFDLDGTLLDSLKDLADSVNFALREVGLPVLPSEFYRMLVGSGNIELCQRAQVVATLLEADRQGKLDLLACRLGLADVGLPLGTTSLEPVWLDCARDQTCRQPIADPDLAQTLFEIFQIRYRATWRDNTKLYPGISEVLDNLYAAGFPFSVYSNKDEALVHDIMRFCARPELFAVVKGKAKGAALKPDPAISLEIAQTMTVPPERVLFFGDSDVDIRTARNARMIPIGVTWGFRPKEELSGAGAMRLIDHPNEIESVVWEWEKNADAIFK
ncbi:MAG: HAD family hydrolase [Fastidiosipilaceae bacterium]|jgi:phosphoglycolate phosphatase